MSSIVNWFCEKKRKDIISAKEKTIDFFISKILVACSKQLKS
jgi:hypothetical protein